MADLKTEPPKKTSYDVVIVGGAMYGSSIASFLMHNPDFDASVLVVERDPGYENSATARTNSCIRQQFSNEINVRISQFGAEYIKNFRSFMDNDSRVPEVTLQSYGYMYMAGNEQSAAIMRECQQIQADCGAATKFMLPEDIARDYPFYNLEGVVGANHNKVDEGYFDGNTLFDWWKRTAREKGVEYIANEVTAMTLNNAGTQVESVTLKSGEIVSCGTVVNASGTRGAVTARMAGIKIPIEPRLRYTFIFAAEKPLNRDLPLTIDPSGVHMRTDGQYYMAGCPGYSDPAVDFDDFTIDHSVWEEKAWPAIANRIPQFEAIKLMNTWMGQYDYNTLDQNAITGRHPKVSNFVFANGFSGHGFQQSPAIGRGTSEVIIYNEYRTLDLSPLGYDRIARNEPFLEKAII